MYKVECGENVSWTDSWAGAYYTAKALHEETEGLIAKIGEGNNLSAWIMNNNVFVIQRVPSKG